MKRKRLLALFIDLLIFTMPSVIVCSFFTVGIFYKAAIMGVSFFCFLCKDCNKGMGPGKYIMGIQVINSKTGQIAEPWKCIIRSLCYFMHFVEFAVFCANSKGLRIGDYLTSTRVAEKNPKLQQNSRSVIYTVGFMFVICAVELAYAYIKYREYGLL